MVQTLAKSGRIPVKKAVLLGAALMCQLGDDGRLASTGEDLPHTATWQ